MLILHSLASWILLFEVQPVFLSLADLIFGQLVVSAILAIRYLIILHISSTLPPHSSHPLAGLAFLFIAHYPSVQTFYSFHHITFTLRVHLSLLFPLYFTGFEAGFHQLWCTSKHLTYLTSFPMRCALPTAQFTSHRRFSSLLSFLLSSELSYMASYICLCFLSHF